MLIVNDQRIARHVTASAFTLCLCIFGPSAARAAESGTTPAAPAATVPQDSAAALPSLASDPISVSLVRDGQTSTVTTHAPTVGALLEERGLHAGPNDYLSLDPAAPLHDGVTLVMRSAVPVTIEIDRSKRQVDSAATTVAGLLAEQHIALRPTDEVLPGPTSELAPQATVRIVHVDSWTSHSHARISPNVKQRVDAKLLRGKSRTLDAGAPGVRELTLRFVKRGDAPPTRVVLASRIVRAPRARVVVRGIATYESLARVAHLGFARAIQFASSALHMLATAYTAGCYGCSGITASGARAGFGVIAVDPRMIPLGTHLFIPGYGPAIAGDTGGAILGSHVDLGFDSNGEAMRWGTRPVTVYILK